MDLRKLYDDIMELQAALELFHDDPELHIPDYRKIKALAATYELQEYLSNTIAAAEASGEIEPEEEYVPEDEEEVLSATPSTDSYVSDTEVLWQTTVTEGTESDIILLQHPDGCFGFDINIGHKFITRQDEINYLQAVLAAFTAWMKENGFDTGRTLSFETAYEFDSTYMLLKSVEELYCFVKMAITGFCNA